MGLRLMMALADAAVEIHLHCGPATEGQTQLQKGSCVGEDAVSCGRECRAKGPLEFSQQGRRRGTPHDIAVFFSGCLSPV